MSKLTKGLAPRRLIPAVMVAIVAIVGVQVVNTQMAGASSTGSGVSLAKCLNIRSGPTTNASRLGCIPKWTRVTITCTTRGMNIAGPYGSTNLWDRISYGSHKGFVSDAFMRTGTWSPVAPACKSVGPEAPPPSGMRVTTKKCADLVVIGARGSGQSVWDGSIYGFGPQVTETVKNGIARIHRTGTVRYEGLSTAKYPAVGVPDVIRNWLVTLNEDRYWDSVRKGANSTMKIVKNTAPGCPSTMFALVGYSQGASVMRWAIRDLPNPLKERVVLVGLIGDPERRGISSLPVDFGEHVFDSTGAWGNGFLGRGPLLPEWRRSTIVTACFPSDDVCNRTGGYSFSSHIHDYQKWPGVYEVGYGFYRALSRNGFK